MLFVPLPVLPGALPRRAERLATKQLLRRVGDQATGRRLLALFTRSSSSFTHRASIFCYHPRTRAAKQRTFLQKTRRARRARAFLCRWRAARQNSWRGTFRRDGGARACPAHRISRRELPSLRCRLGVAGMWHHVISSLCLWEKEEEGRKEHT